MSGRTAGDRTLVRRARPTLTPVELDPGETLAFTLRSGRTVTLKLIDAMAAPLFTDLNPAGATVHGDPPPIQGITVYHFTAIVEVDGHRAALQRYVGCQESFYEPYVVNGLRIWFDAVSDVFEFLTEDHGACRPGKRARFAVQDATLAICPEPVAPWFPARDRFIDIRECYMGDDCWMGAYAGEDAHGGLDVNLPDGTPHFAPVSLDRQGLSHSTARGDGNNRWEGVRRWVDGSLWRLKVSHVIEHRAREGAPLKRGALIGLGAGMAVGYREHTHLVFHVEDGGRVYHLDPWILLWQAFENGRAASPEPVAGMAVPGPARAGKAAEFTAAGTRTGGSGRKLDLAWTFGDGGFAAGRTVRHAFARPGIYPVTLTVDDGVERRSCTRHLTVDGRPPLRPALVCSLPGEPSFRPRPAHVADVYGSPPPAPHTIRFTAMSPAAIEMWRHVKPGSREPVPPRWLPRPERVRLAGVGGRGRARPSPPAVAYHRGFGWLATRLVEGGRAVEVAVRPGTLRAGLYRATVAVRVPGMLNSPQAFRVELRMTAESPRWHAAVDDRDPGCEPTPYFWIAPPLPSWWARPGHGGRALLNGRRPVRGETVRFTPYLWGGRYEVWLGQATPFEPGCRFAVRVRDRAGVRTVWVEPARSRKVGTFDFHFGTRGWVEIEAGGSRGQVAADCVFFVRAEDSKFRTWDVGVPARETFPLAMKRR